eukprot:1864562-Rhodomonas_salina.3
MSTGPPPAFVRSLCVAQAELLSTGRCIARLLAIGAYADPSTRTAGTNSTVCTAGTNRTVCSAGTNSTVCKPVACTRLRSTYCRWWVETVGFKQRWYKSTRKGTLLARVRSRLPG